MARLAPDASLPDWAATPSGPVWTVTRTAHECSVCCADEAVPEDVPALRALRVLTLDPPPHPDAVGVLAGVTRQLADAGCWVLAICTHDTDYVLVRASELDRVPLG